jgi:hypothetical protein
VASGVGGRGRDVRVVAFWAIGITRRADYFTRVEFVRQLDLGRE